MANECVLNQNIRWWWIVKSVLYLTSFSVSIWLEAGRPGQSNSGHSKEKTPKALLRNRTLALGLQPLTLMTVLSVLPFNELQTQWSKLLVMRILNIFLLPILSLYLYSPSNFLLSILELPSQPLLSNHHETWHLLLPLYFWSAPWKNKMHS